MRITLRQLRSLIKETVKVGLDHAEVQARWPDAYERWKIWEERAGYDIRDTVFSIDTEEWKKLPAWMNPEHESLVARSPRDSRQFMWARSKMWRPIEDHGPSLSDFVKLSPLNKDMN